MVQANLKPGEGYLLSCSSREDCNGVFDSNGNRLAPVGQEPDNECGIDYYRIDLNT